MAKISAAVAAGAAIGPAAIEAFQAALGGAFAGAVSAIELPGGAAVAATLGGAGKAAAAADAAVAAGGFAALASTFIVPVLIAGGVVGAATL